MHWAATVQLADWRAPGQRVSSAGRASAMVQPACWPAAAGRGWEAPPLLPLGGARRDHFLAAGRPSPPLAWIAHTVVHSPRQYFLDLKASLNTMTSLRMLSGPRPGAPARAGPAVSGSRGGRPCVQSGAAHHSHRAGRPAGRSACSWPPGCPSPLSGTGPALGPCRLRRRGRSAPAQVVCRPRPAAGSCRQRTRRGQRVRDVGEVAAVNQLGLCLGCRGGREHSLRARARVSAGQPSLQQSCARRQGAHQGQTGARSACKGALAARRVLRSLRTLRWSPARADK